MTASRSGKGNGGGNGRIASWHRLLKQERAYLIHFRTRTEARAARFEYFEIFYHRRRLHRALGGTARPRGRPRPISPPKR